MRIVEVAICARKWIYLFFTWLNMACKLPAMVYSSPIKEETLELDFGDCKQPSVRRKTRLKRDENITYSNWAFLPDLLLEDIFSRLTIRERYYASQVCRNWNRIFYSKRVWNTFVLEDRTLTRRKFNYYMGDQFVLDHHRTQLCLNKVARGIRSIIIKPMENFFNLYEFMTILSYFCENYEQLNLIRTLDFTFVCELSEENPHGTEEKNFGTGGKLLQALKRLMDDLAGLKHLSLQDLLLEKLFTVTLLAMMRSRTEIRKEQVCKIPVQLERDKSREREAILFYTSSVEDAEYLLDDVAYNCCETLRTLRVVNCSKEPFAMLHPVVFVNLQSLTISPQHLNDDIVVLLGNTRVRDIYLLQTKQTPSCNSVSFKSWKECKKASRRLNVHHIMEGEVKTKIIWQEGAPVKSVIYNTPQKGACITSLFDISNFYCNTLEVLAFTGLPQYSLHDSFEERIDTSLILLGRSCPYLDTLMVRDQISTATLILLAHYCKNLRRLIVRKFAVIRKCDWPRNPEWTDSFYNWLRLTSGSYENTIKEISNLLESKWRPLGDEEFKHFRL